MTWIQKTIVLRGYTRGIHLITETVRHAAEGIANINTGMMNLFLQHTSAGLTLNENADPSVRRDFQQYLSHTVPDGAEYFTHTLEGVDDMSAHIKTSLIGQSLSIPIGNGHPLLGTWQGIYFCEFRNTPSPRKLIITVNGEI